MRGELTPNFYDEHDRHLVVKWGKVDSNYSNPFGPKYSQQKYFLSVETGSGIELVRTNEFDPTYARYFSLSSYPEAMSNNYGVIKVNNLDKCYSWNHMSKYG